MKKKLVAFVVGHEHWGKSYTLLALKQICGSRRRHWYVAIENSRFRVRTASNDDFPKQYKNFILSYSGTHLIAALCPKFRKFSNYNRREKTVEEVLRGLRRRGYMLVFWVIKHRWSEPVRVVSEEEISELRKYGKVKVLDQARVRDRERAKRFRSFVLSAL